MTGIDDVARASGVSTATVSRALRGLPNVAAETRETVRRAADALGYVPSSSAAGLATGRTMAMGAVVPSVSRWFYTAVLEGIDRELRSASYDLILFNLGGRGGDRSRVFHRSILRKRTDALVALCLDFSAEERRQLASTGHPAIVVGGPVRGIRHIGIDDLGIACAATQHLIELGHREIAFLGGDDEEGLNHVVPQARRAGWERAMAAAGLPVRPDLVLHGGFDTATSRRVVDAMLHAGRRHPTAIFAGSDEMALGALLSLWAQGLRVPQDVSVIGIDGHPLSRVFSLSTFEQDPGEQGATAVRMLLAELAGDPARPRSLRHPVRFVDRGSTAPPPSTAP
ncbi:LacI family DNA-binding transcriptional regulator [Humibacter ginsengisoli]